MQDFDFDKQVYPETIVIDGVANKAKKESMMRIDYLEDAHLSLCLRTKWQDIGDIIFLSASPPLQRATEDRSTDLD